MTNPESPNQVSVPAPLTLDRATVGRAFVVEGVADLRAAAAAGRDDLASALAAEGIVQGVEVTPERRLPLGGPIVVRLGRARLALGRDVARRLVLRPVDPGTDCDGRR